MKTEGAIKHTAAYCSATSECDEHKD